MSRSSALTFYRIECITYCAYIIAELKIYTKREKLEIASTRRTWEFLLEILKNL